LLWTIGNRKEVKKEREKVPNYKVWIRFLDASSELDEFNHRVPQNTLIKLAPKVQLLVSFVWLIGFMLK
jgi:hypothetical protein